MSKKTEFQKHKSIFKKLDNMIEKYGPKYACSMPIIKGKAVRVKKGE